MIVMLQHASTLNHVTYYQNAILLSSCWQVVQFHNLLMGICFLGPFMVITLVQAPQKQILSQEFKPRLFTWEAQENI